MTDGGWGWWPSCPVTRWLLVTAGHWITLFPRLEQDTRQHLNLLHVLYNTNTNYLTSLILETKQFRFERQIIQSKVAFGNVEKFQVGTAISSKSN